MQVKAARAPPPLSLEHGYANEENEVRGMAAPKSGVFEVVNKNRQGEIIGVLVAANAEELVLRRDPNGYVDTHLCLLPEQTVMHATFDEEPSTLQVCGRAQPDTRPLQWRAWAARVTRRAARVALGRLRSSTAASTSRWTRRSPARSGTTLSSSRCTRRPAAARTSC